MSINTFLGVVDRIINLVERRNVERRRLFSEIVHPLFQEMEPVVEDCFLVFRQTRDFILINPTIKLSVLLENRKPCSVHLPARLKIRSMAKIVRERIRDENIAEFTDKIVHFFYNSGVSEADYALDPIRLSISLTAELEQRLYELINTEKSREDTLDFINETLLEMENNWSAIVASYTKLKLQLLCTS